MRHFVFTLLVVLSSGFALPSIADGLAPPPQGAIYIGQGQMLEAAQPRQLSLNAYISQFEYQPGGLEIACVGMQIDGHKVTQSIRLVGVKSGSTLATLLSQTSQVNDDGTYAEPDSIYWTHMEGWSGDGRYLLVAQDGMKTVPGQAEKHDVTNYFCIDVGQETIHVTPIALPPDQNSTQVSFSWSGWSLNRTLLLFGKKSFIYDGDKSYHADTYAAVYDPVKNYSRPITLPAKSSVCGWLDSDHILVVSQADATAHYFTDDLVTGRFTEIANPAKMPHLGDEVIPPTPASSPSPKSPLLVLENEAKTATDEPKTASAPFHALWVRRTKGIKPLSAMPVGLTPGTFDPEARWSPTGKEIAFTVRGDLFVTDLAERDATAYEKWLAGETLTCQEEQAVAASNLKQIGLAIAQYIQDHNEKYPDAAGVKDAIMPYLKDATLFSIGGHAFVYHAPPKIMAFPADTILGTLDLPCAQIVLLADGHVKTWPKANGAGTTPGGAGR